MITINAEKFKKFPSWIYKSAAQLYIDRDFPRHLFIETTAACNLSCEYCPREKIKSHMDFELFKGIIDEASRYGPRSFSLHLFGEPLLYPKAFEAIQYIKEKNRKNTVLLTSNGTLFNRYIDEITKSGIDKLIWSWRPEAKFSEETKEKLRRWGKLTVRVIKEVVPEEAKVEWRNWEGYEERNLHNYGGNIGNAFIAGTQTRWPCYHLFLAPAVSWNGNILICCADPHQKEIMGKFPQQSIHRAWVNMSKIRTAHLNGQFNGICEKCDVWKNYPDLFFKWQQ